MQTAKIIQDESDAMMYLSPLYSKVFQRENMTYNTIHSIQNKQIIDNSSVPMDMLTYMIPNQNFINVADSYLSMKIKITIGTTAAGDKIIQRKGKLIKKLALDNSESDVKILPVSARCLFDRV